MDGVELSSGKTDDVKTNGLLQVGYVSTIL